jgi:hypothetical protein
VRLAEQRVPLILHSKWGGAGGGGWLGLRARTVADCRRGGRGRGRMRAGRRHNLQGVRRTTRRGALAPKAAASGGLAFSWLPRRVSIAVCS